MKLIITEVDTNCLNDKDYNLYLFSNSFEKIKLTGNKFHFCMLTLTYILT